MVGISFKKKLDHIVFLETYSTYDDYQKTNTLEVPLESLIIYFIHKFCTTRFVDLKFLSVNKGVENGTPVTLFDDNIKFVEASAVPWQVAASVYPVVLCNDFIVTGLCAVARHICVYKNCPIMSQEHLDGILGFRQSCLQAPNEVSIWTKFCEIDLIKTAKEMLTTAEIKDLPQNLVRFEDHLKKPVRVHNIYKIAQELVKENLNTEEVKNNEDFKRLVNYGAANQQVQDEDFKQVENDGAAKQKVENELFEQVEKNGAAKQQVEDEDFKQVENDGAAKQKVEDEEFKQIENDGATKQVEDEDFKQVENDGAIKQQVEDEEFKQVENDVATKQQVEDEDFKQVENDGATKQQAEDEDFKQVENDGATKQQVEDEDFKQSIQADKEKESLDTTRVPKSRKWKSNKKENVIDCSTKIEDLNVSHVFAEGPFLTLADLVLLPSYHIIIQSFGEQIFESLLPLTYRWYKNIISLPRLQIYLTCMSKLNLKILLSQNINIPATEDVSLYKCDPKRHNPKKRLFTKEDDIEKALSSITEGMELMVSSNEFQFSLNWDEIPEDANPYAGHLPDWRVTRKSQQLENIAVAVLNIAKEGDLIVDFCCGSGHLGILLAHLLPKCTIILLENKFQSLKRANERVHRMRLNNVFFYQCNVDFFIGKFDIGIGLHACGIATDLILDKCLKANAKFILSPCCYGSLHATDRMAYPRSRKFSSVPIDQYLCIGHTADQTHIEHPLADRGARCMAIIDSDRGRLAEQYGYKVTLTRLKPVTCTPKNNLLIGIPS